MNKLTIVVLVALSLVSIYARADIPPPPEAFKNYQIDLSGVLAKAIYANLPAADSEKDSGKDINACPVSERAGSLLEKNARAKITCEGPVHACWRTKTETTCKIVVSQAYGEELSLDALVKLKKLDRAPSSVGRGNHH